MPQPAPVKTRTIRKLAIGDQGFDPSVEKFEVLEEVVSTVQSTESYSVVALDERITVLKDLKAKDITRWDARIATAEQMKLDLLAES